METRAPSIPKVAVMAVFSLSCIGLLLFVWISFGGPTPFAPTRYEFEVALPEADRLADQADVRIAGVSVGKVVETRRGENRTIATISLERRYAPIPSDARVVLRQKSLLGETYVEITRGSPGAEPVPDGGRLDPANVAATVELDELLSTFDPVTRKAYRTWQRSIADAIDRRGRDVNDALGNLPSFAESGTDLLAVLDTQREALRALVRDTGVVFEALTAREDQLSNLIVNGERVFSAVDSRREAFAQVWRILPTFLTESRLTFDRLRVFAADTRPLVDELLPAADELGPTLQAAGELGPDLRRLLLDLDPLIDSQIETLPQFREILDGARPLLGALGPWLQQVNPVVDWLAIHINTLSDMLANLGAATQARTTSADPRATGHYLRQVAPTGIESQAVWADRLPVNRGNGYINPLGVIVPSVGRTGVIPSFDCNNAGGEKPATTGTDGTPACVVQRPLDTKDFPEIQPGRFPRVGPADYSRGR